MRRLACLACIGTLVVLPSAPAHAQTAEPSAHSAKRCGTIADGRYRVRARVLSCSTARRWSRAYLRRGREPSGYACSRPGGGVALYCRKGDRAFWAERR